MNLFRCYAILETSPLATDWEIKNQHRILSRRFHPDKGGDPARFDEVQKAFANIKDSKSRSTLSIILSGLGEECERCGGKGFTRKRTSFTSSITAPCHECGACGYIPRKLQ